MQASFFTGLSFLWFGCKEGIWLRDSARNRGGSKISCGAYGCNAIQGGTYLPSIFCGVVCAQRDNEALCASLSVCLLYVVYINLAWLMGVVRVGGWPNDGPLHFAGVWQYSHFRVWASVGFPHFSGDLLGHIWFSACQVLDGLSSKCQARHLKAEHTCHPVHILRCRCCVRTGSHNVIMETLCARLSSCLWFVVCVNLGGLLGGVRVGG
jgi:hypothetical protein